MIDPLRTDLVPLAILGGIGTYAARALPLLAPGADRLPAPVLAYLRLIGPAVLGAIAAANVFVDDASLRVGPEAVAQLDPVEVNHAAIVARSRSTAITDAAMPTKRLPRQRPINAPTTTATASGPTRSEASSTNTFAAAIAPSTAGPISRR